MSVRNPTKARRKYDASFKEDVLKMVASGRPVSEVAQALGISVSLIHRWNRKSTSAPSGSAIASTSLSAVQSNLANEFQRHKADLRRTEMERDILKKALAIFSRTI